jgi:hypothetical protein
MVMSEEGGQTGKMAAQKDAQKAHMWNMAMPGQVSGYLGGGEAQSDACSMLNCHWNGLAK